MARTHTNTMVSGDIPSHVPPPARVPKVIPAPRVPAEQVQVWKREDVCVC